MKKACVFVDGENFRHSIVELFETFDQRDYLPKLAEWDKLFDWIVKEGMEDGERVRTYWYVIKTMDFYPYKLPNPNDITSFSTSKMESLKRLLSKHAPYKTELDSLAGEALCNRMKEIVDEYIKRRSVMQKRFNGWIEIQESISAKYKAIEFRRAGAMQYSLFQNSLGREKAVDVKLSCDMLMLSDIYDYAIIVSGDQDYVPAVEMVKDFGKTVINVAFKTRSGKLLPGGARRLNQITDWSLDLEYEQLAEHLKIGQISFTNNPNSLANC